jgi:hypothetical protein
MLIGVKLLKQFKGNDSLFKPSCPAFVYRLPVNEFPLTIERTPACPP